jgi:hypothetical protein
MADTQKRQQLLEVINDPLSSPEMVTAASAALSKLDTKKDAPMFTSVDGKVTLPRTVEKNPMYRDATSPDLHVDGFVGPIEISESYAEELAAEYPVAYPNGNNATQWAAAIKAMALSSAYHWSEKAYKNQVAAGTRFNAPFDRNDPQGWAKAEFLYKFPDSEAQWDVVIERATKYYGVGGEGDSAPGWQERWAARIAARTCSWQKKA